MKKPIIGFVQAPNYDNKVVNSKAQVSKPKKPKLMLNKPMFVSLDGTVVDKHSFAEWERDKPNASWE
jgi:hypothetical protein